jgi:hypothetical protein
VSGRLEQLERLERLEQLERLEAWLTGDGFGYVVVGTWLLVGAYYLAGSWRRARRALRELSDPAASVGGAPQAGANGAPAPPGKDLAP